MATSPFTFTFGFMPPHSPTPTLYGDVINYGRQVDAEIASLNNDMAAGKIALSPEFVITRNAFCAEWIAFFGAYQDWGWATGLPSGAWDQVGQYQAKNEAWKEQFRALGGKPTGPGPQERPAPPDITGAVKWGAAAVIFTAVAYGAYRVLA